jgi:hypothetical protein
MGKSHRDNHRARVKRGDAAFAKKARRRAAKKKIKCNLCGTGTRPQHLKAGICPRCYEQVESRMG